MGTQNESPSGRKGGGPLLERSDPVDKKRGDTSGRSDRGCEREANEDRFLIVQRKNLSGYFVFDGMGGQPGGEAAAQISSDVINGALNTSDGRDLISLMNDSIETAQAAILSRRGSPNTDGMGTTVVGVLIRGDEVVVGSVGDSRAYHIRGEKIAQLTNDHTLVQQLVDAGRISAQDALLHPQSHILTRCLGSESEFAIDIKRLCLNPLKKGESPNEWLLLCSDGLYSLVTEDEMVAIVLTSPPEDATQKFIQLARHRGGFDNITAVVVPIKGRLLDFRPREDLVREDNPQEVISSDELSEQCSGEPLVLSESALRAQPHPSSKWAIAAMIAMFSAVAIVLCAMFISSF
jgi:serine/threonine protein phosphatase PrpC